MIQDIENKSKKELVEIVKIQQEEYQILANAFMQQERDLQELRAVIETHRAEKKEEFMNRVCEKMQQKRDLEMKAAGIQEAVSQAKAKCNWRDSTHYQSVAFVREIESAALVLSQQAQEIGK